MTKVNVSINFNYKNYFIGVELVETFQVCTQYIESKNAQGVNIQMFNYYKINMNIYVLKFTVIKYYYE